MVCVCVCARARVHCQVRQRQQEICKPYLVKRSEEATEAAAQGRLVHRLLGTPSPPISCHQQAGDQFLSWSTREEKEDKGKNHTRTDTETSVLRAKPLRVQVDI